MCACYCQLVVGWLLIVVVIAVITDVVVGCVFSVAIVVDFVCHL